MAIEEFMKYRTSDGMEHDTLAAAEAHEEHSSYAIAAAQIGLAELLVSPMSARSQAFEKIGLEIRDARLKAGGSKRQRKSALPSGAEYAADRDVRTEALRAELMACCAGAPEDDAETSGMGMTESAPGEEEPF